MQYHKPTLGLALCAAFAGLLSAAPASASVLLASDNFNTYAAGGLGGENGGSGWGGAWTEDLGSSFANVVATAVSDNPMSGNAVRLTGNSDAIAARTLAVTQSGNVIVNFLFQFDAGTVSNNDFLGLWFGNSNGPNIGLKANCGTGNCTNDIFARTSGSDAGGNTLNINVGQTYSIMGYLQKTGTSAVYNRFELWVDPTAAERATLTGFDAVDTGNSNVSSFNQIGFRTATLSTGEALLIDDLSVSRVPEPGTLALLGLALVGLGARRRKSVAA